MGAHRQQKPDASLKAICPSTIWPPFPHNIGKTRLIPAIDKSIRHFLIEDEIVRKQSNSERKIIVFQKMRFLEEKRYEFRFGYYMIGHVGKTKGRWVWGQFCLLIPQEDLMALMKEAKKRKWFSKPSK
jgi:hypothetical protein